MIGLKEKTKIGKSPKKMQVELREDSADDEHESEYDSETEVNSESNDNDSGNIKSMAEGNPGWADVMQKILRTNKPKRKKTLVLSKAKRLCDVVKKEHKEEGVPFEIVNAKGELKVENKEFEETVPTIEKPPAQPKHRRKDNLGIRVKPSIEDRERERLLQKIATKGVVQLFNAVKQQQGEISQKLSEAGPLERKREKVLKSIDKRAFLDVLMGGSKSIQVDNTVKDETQEKKKNKDDKVWNVLREDFVMGAKLKDWDRNSGEEDSSAPEDMDSDDQN